MPKRYRTKKRKTRGKSKSKTRKYYKRKNSTKTKKRKTKQRGKGFFSKKKEKLKSTGKSLYKGVGKIANEAMYLIEPSLAAGPENFSKSKKQLQPSNTPIPQNVTPQQQTNDKCPPCVC